MTLKQSEHIHDVSQQRKIRISHEQMGTKHLDEGQVNEKKTSGGGIDHLLILANSAELVLESEDNLHSANENDQIHEGPHTTPISQQSKELPSATPTDKRPCGEQLDGMQANTHVEIEDGSHRHVKTTRLSQIRRQARSKNHSVVKEKTGEYIHGQLHGRTIRLSTIRRQARSKNILSMQDGIKEHRHVQLGSQSSEVNLEAENKVICGKGRMRLSQLRREARNAHVAQGHSGTLNRGEEEDHSAF